MSEKIKRVAVLGLGRVGTLAATLLHETGFDVVGAVGRLYAGIVATILSWPGFPRGFQDFVP